MEKNNDILHEIITNAYRESKPRALSEIVQFIFGRVNLKTCFIQKNDVEKLNKLGLCADDLETSFLVGLVYNCVLSYKLVSTDSLDPEVILTMVNVLLPIYEKIPGTILARRLVVHIKNMLITLIKRPELSTEEKTQIFDLLRLPNIRQDNIFMNFDHTNEAKDIQKQLKSQSTYNKVNAMMNLFKIFSSCNDLEEQLDIFTKKVPDLIKLGTSTLDDKPKDFLELIGHIAENMLFQTEYLVKLNKEIVDTYDRREQPDPLFINVELDPSSPEESEGKSPRPNSREPILTYKLIEQEMVLKSNAHIYPTVLFLIGIFLKYPHEAEIQKVCINILRRLHNIFPKYRKNLEEHIIKAFTNLNQNSSEIGKKEASIFLYKLIHRDGAQNFQERLRDQPQFSNLYKTPFYNNCVLNNKVNTLEAVNLGDLKVQVTFPNVRTIGAGSSFTIYMEVWRPLSILYWNFSLANHDIGFSLSRILSFDRLPHDKKVGPLVIYQGEKIEAAKNPCRGRVVINEPGIFKLEWDNSHSWFNAKELKYCVYVLEPDFGIDASQVVKNGNEHEEVTEEEETKKNGHEENKEKTPRSHVENNVQQDNENKIENFGILFINEGEIEFTVKTQEKSHETTIAFDKENVNWHTVNSKIIELLKQAIEIGQDSNENKLDLKIVYDQKVLSAIYKENIQNRKILQQKLRSSLLFLNIIKANIGQNLKIVNKIEHVIERLLESQHLQTRENVFVICLDGFSKRFYSRYKGKAKEHKGLDINSICLTNGENNEGPLVLKNIADLYFGAEQQKKKIAYLAALLINVFNYYGANISQFLLFENEEEPVWGEDNQQLVREAFEKFTKKQGLAEEGPEVTFCDIKL